MNCDIHHLLETSEKHGVNIQLLGNLNDISSSNTDLMPSASSSFSCPSLGTSSCQTRVSWAPSLACPEPPGYHEVLAVSAFGLGIPPLFLEPKEAFEIVDELAAACVFVQMSKFVDS